MLLLAYLLIGISAVLSAILSFFYILLIARVIISWVSADPRNPLVQFIYNTTEPILVPIRKRIPPLGMFDLSVLVAFLVCIFLNQFFVGYLRDQGTIWREKANRSSVSSTV